MPAAKDNSVSVEVHRTEDGKLVQYGVVSDGAFHPFYSERAPDYDERVKAAQDESE